MAAKNLIQIFIQQVEIYDWTFGVLSNVNNNNDRVYSLVIGPALKTKKIDFSRINSCCLKNKYQFLISTSKSITGPLIVFTDVNK